MKLETKRKRRVNEVSDEEKRRFLKLDTKRRKGL